MVHHHPPEELLLDYVSGALTGAAAALVAGHATFCPACRRHIQDMEAMAGAFMALELGKAEPAALTGAPNLEMEGMGPVPDAAPAYYDPVLPKPVFDLFKLASKDIPWTRLLSGVREFRKEGRDGEDIRLMHIAPGKSIPQHTHRGLEMTLVLSGSFSDREVEYRTGDVALADGSIDHKPVAGAQSDCLCFVVSEAPLRLTGPVGRVWEFFQTR